MHAVCNSIMYAVCNSITYAVCNSIMYAVCNTVRSLSGYWLPWHRIFPALVTNEEEEDLNNVWVDAETGQTNFIIVMCLGIENHCFLSFNAEYPR